MYFEFTGQKKQQCYRVCVKFQALSGHYEEQNDHILIYTCKTCIANSELPIDLTSLPVQISKTVCSIKKKRQETVEQCQAEWGGAHLNSSNFIMEALIHRECDGVQRVPHV